MPETSVKNRTVLFPSTMLHDEDFFKIINYNTVVGITDVPGHIPNHIIGISGFGTISTTVYNIISNILAIQPSLNTAMKILSTSSQDGVGGSGAQQITIDFFNSSWSKKTEVITMNGTTPVNLTNTDVYRIDRLYINKAGSDSGANGTITLVDAASGLIKYAQIEVASTFFERAVHYIETGKRCIITEASISSFTLGGVIIRLFITNEDSNGNIVPRAEFSFVITSSISFTPFVLPISVKNPNGKRIAIGIATKGITSNQSCTGTLRFYEEDI